MVAIYIRVSTEGQVKNQAGEEKASIELQKKEGIAFAEKQGEKYRIYQEAYSAGKKGQGHEWDRLLSDISSGFISIVFIRKLDRVPRDLGLFRELKKLCKESSTQLYIDQNGGFQDLKSRGANFASDLQALVSEYERGNIKDRLYDGLKKMYDDGLRVTPASYGWYTDGYVPLTGRKRWLVNEKEKEMVLKVFDLALMTKKGLSEIAREVNRLGYRTRNGKPFDHSTIHQILTNKVFAGKTHNSKDEIIDSKIYTPFISYDDFKKINGDYVKKYTSHKRGRRPCHPLTGILECAECGTKYYYFYGVDKRRIDKNGNPKKMEAYVHGARIGCGGKKRIDYVTMDNLAALLYKYAMDDPTQLIKQLEKTLSQEEERIAEERDRLQGLYDNNSRKIMKLTKIIQDIDDLPDDDETLAEVRAFKKDNIQIRKEQEKLDEALEARKAPLKKAIVQFARRKLDDYDNANGLERRQMLRDIIKEMKIDSEGNINTVLIDGRIRSYLYSELLEKKKLYHKAIARLEKPTVWQLALVQVLVNLQDELLRASVEGKNGENIRALINDCQTYLFDPETNIPKRSQDRLDKMAEQEADNLLYTKIKPSPKVRGSPKAPQKPTRGRRIPGIKME